MNRSKMDVIVVDAGNSRIKVAAFFEDKILELKHFQVSQSQDFSEYIFQHKDIPIFVSSVLSEEQLSHFLGDKKKVHFFSKDSILPITLKYDTPHTLGLDRLANAVAIHFLQPNGNKVSIDFGTCIKFDFVNENGEYLGGSISPGIQMRYQAMNHFTGKLPLLHFNKKDKLIGTNTHDSMHSGVNNGVVGEIVHMMNLYEQDYQDLTFFVTGGDANYFDLPSKNNIFAHENLTLVGLNYIYKQNA